MFYRIEELRNKQVVCVHSGDVLGYVSDIEIDSLTGKIESVVIFGKPRILGLFGKREDIIIPWAEIEVLGTETILVKSNSKYCKST
jgi:YlmC/YmxH family sporulation protein